MATPIKEGCKAIFGWGEEHVNGSLKEVTDHNFGVSPREAMQLLGTEFGRGMINPKLWEILAHDRIQAKLKTSNIVVSDIRYDNEAEMIKSLGGDVWRVSRPVRDLIKGISGHISENGILDTLVSRRLLNNSSISDLMKLIKDTINQDNDNDNDKYSNHTSSTLITKRSQ